MPNVDPTLAKFTSNNIIDKVAIKFHAPKKLKSALEYQAGLRNVSLSAFMRIISSEYLQRIKSQ
jgi:hypothetical protein